MAVDDVGIAKGARASRRPLETATLVALLAASTLVAGFIVVTGYRNWFSPPPTAAEIPIPSTPLSIDTAAIRGSRSAPVAIVVYSEFRCPFCAQFARDTFPTLVKEYIDSGRVLFAFRHFPNDGHRLSREAASAAACASEQGAFWGAHDVFFQDLTRVDAAFVDAVPKVLGLDDLRYRACLKKAGPALVDSDIASARALHVRGTPAFFIGMLRQGGLLSVERTIRGARPIADFQQALDELLKRAATKPRS